MFCRSLFCLLLPWYCVSIFDIRLLLTPLTSSNFAVEVTASTYPLGNIRSVASLLTYTIYQKYMTGSTSSAICYKLWAMYYIQREQRGFFYISHYSVKEINPFHGKHDGTGKLIFFIRGGIIVERTNFDHTCVFYMI